MSFSNTRDWAALATSLGVYCGTLLLVVAGIAFGRLAMEPSTGPHSPRRVAARGESLVDPLTLWDGQWYLEIADRGYSYNRHRMSSVAFFPGYPMLIWGVSMVTRLPSAWAALLISNGFLAAAYWLLFVYTRLRFHDAPLSLPIYTVLAAALFPPTFSMRMAYSESLFLFLTVLAMYGIARNWPWWQIAAIMALATGTRLAGVALVVPLAIHIWKTSDSPYRATVRLATSVPLALGGLAGYALYQLWDFGTAAAFIQTQDFWRHRISAILFDKIISLISLEPVWSAYWRASPGYVGRVYDTAPALFSLQFANPVFFVGAIALVSLGSLKGWLTWPEIALAACLILIPYAGKGFEMCMASQGRFVSVAFPIYLVLGNILCRLPRPVAIATLTVFGGYLAIYSAMLAAGYVLI